MSSDNYLGVLGRKVYSLSASDGRAEWRKILTANPIHVARSQEEAVEWIETHDQPFDDAYAEYGLAYVVNHWWDLPR